MSAGGEVRLPVFAMGKDKPEEADNLAVAMRGYTRGQHYFEVKVGQKKLSVCSPLNLP